MIDTGYGLKGETMPPRNTGGNARAAMLRVPQGTVGTLERPDGTRLHTLDAGTGTPVLLVHGGLASLNQWSLTQPALLDRGHRVIAYDHRGHGKSTLGRSGFTTRALFDDLVAVVEHFDLHDLTIVGHSMGTFASIGALAAPKLRARTRRVVLVSPMTGRLGSGSPRAIRMTLPLARSAVLPLLLRSRRARRLMAPRGLGHATSPDVREATERLLAAMPIAMAPRMRIFETETIEAVLPELDLPIRVLWGTADTAAPAWHGRLIVDRAPHADLVQLPGIGHMVNWEAPDAITDAIEATTWRATPRNR
jgi:non-heme chloroperoxidase